MKKIILLLTFLVIYKLQNGNAQAPSIQWQSTLGTGYDPTIRQTNDGGYITAGYSDSNNGNHGSTDYWVVKLDIYGSIMWQKSFGGTDQDICTSIELTDDGGYIVAGRSYSNDINVSAHHGSTGLPDYWIVKLDSLGNIIWQKSLGGTDSDNASSIQQTNDGGYIVAGFSSSNNGDLTGNHGDYDYWIVKLDNSGNILWQKSLGGTGSDEAYSIRKTVDGGYVIAGATNSMDGNVSGNLGGWSGWIVKLDAFGNLLWQKTYPGYGDDYVARSIKQTIDNGFIIAGAISNGGRNYFIVKMDSLGNIIWQKSLGGTGDEAALSIQQTNDNGYIVAGYSISNNGDVTGNHGGFDYWIVKLDSSGNLSWESSLGGPFHDIGNCVQQTNDGGYIISGAKNYSEIWIVKLFPPSNAIPTLSEWGIIIFGLLMIIVLIWFLKKHQFNLT